MKFEVNKKMLPMKAHYFFYNAATAPVVPFMPTLARQLGFSTLVVGTIYTILPIIGLLVKPLFGFIADRFRIRKTLFLACQLLTVVAFFGIKFIRPIQPPPAPVQFHCNRGVADLRFCSPRLDHCAAVALANIEDSSASSVSCELRCHANDSWPAEHGLCAKQSGSSNSSNSGCPFDMLALIQPNHIELLGECLLFEIKEAFAPPTTTQALTCPRHTATDGTTTAAEHNNAAFSANCTMRCNDERIEHTISSSIREDANASWNVPQFWAFFLCLVFSWAGMAAVVSLSDAICFHMLGDRPNLYGQQRLWGGVGWGIFSLLAGVLVDEMSRGQVLKDYSGVFYMMVVLMAADLVFSTRLDDRTNAASGGGGSNGGGGAPVSANVWRDISLLFVSPAVCVFFAWCIVIGMGTALIWNFLFWHLENLAADAAAATPTASDSVAAVCSGDSGEWMKTLQGLAMGIQCFAGEIPFFFLSGTVLKRIGHVHAMSLVLLAFGVRFLLYSVLTNPWWVLPIETMQGITFGIFIATMASYASIVAPPGTESTLQGLVGAVFEGIGVASGSFIGGYLIDWLGGSMTFRLFGVAALVIFVVHIVVQKLLEKCTGGKAVCNGEDVGGDDVVVIDSVAVLDDGVREGCLKVDGASVGRMQQHEKA